MGHHLRCRLFALSFVTIISMERTEAALATVVGGFVQYRMLSGRTHAGCVFCEWQGECSCVACGVCNDRVM